MSQRTRSPRRASAADRERALFAGALDEMLGAALVLDAQLRVRVASRGAEQVLGFEVPIGGSAVTLLFGDRTQHPFAEALADERAFQAVIPRPGRREPAAIEHVRVRSVPFGDAIATFGWIVHVSALEGGADTEPVLFHGIWTRDPRVKQMFRIIEKVAAEDVTVLVRGETGTGKELVAQAIHALSPRHEGPFRAINCAALPPNLLESELFGHVRGAFTGAVRDVPGHLQLADGGTLFLDEVAELSLELQAKLLRVIETRAVLPVGARDASPVDVRFVSATHRALRAEVATGRFRADLMYRLRVIPIRLLPLRERPGDVLLIAGKIIDQLNARGRRRIASISPAAEAAMVRYEWLGNVRELRNALAYAFAIGDGTVLELADLPPEIATPGRDDPEVTVMAAPLSVDAGTDPELRRVKDALARTAGSRDRAAKLLGMSRVTLWRRMRALGLDKI
ncbi:MAG TPA: sigma 54-interacting transcriptional regulator [Kofleriaceae bacterium]|jgi:transcriptional regulator with PAS, ATPase and Fis domain|nr:sigma 54-interacting transcriptional regulator [Kofleriaceae bacterium]